jgi:hypothetical protein
MARKINRSVPRDVSERLYFDLLTNGKPSEFIAAMQEIISNHGDDVDVDYTTSGYDCVEIDITRWRKETTAEVEHRILLEDEAHERNRVQKDLDAAKDVRRKEFIKLKKEFGH